MLFIRLGLILFLSFFGGCSQHSPTKTSCFRMNLWIDPATLDPRKARDINAITTCRMLFEGLTRVGKDGKPELAVAKSVEVSNDGLEYVFHLRDTSWSDGSPVTAHHFAESWKTALRPDFPTDVAYQLYVIQNAQDIKQGLKKAEELAVSTPDPLTLIVRLEKPTPYFLEACSMPVFFPVSGITSEDWGTKIETLIFNGPFILKTWDHNSEIRLQKNPTYWEKDQVHLQEVSLVMVASDTEIQMFEEGELDFAGGLLSRIPMDAVEHLQETGQLKKNPVSGTRFVRINTSEKIGNTPNILSTIAFRKALSYAIDRAAITQHVLHGTKPPAHSLVPPEMELHYPSFDQPKEMAPLFLQDALETMGQTVSSLPPLVLSFIDMELNRALAQVIQQQWEEALGIRVELQALELKVFYQKLREKEFQVVLGSWIADFNDPINFLEVFKFKNGGSNNTNWENEKYIALLNQSAICRDQAERRSILGEAEKILMAEMPIIPLYHEAMSFLQREEVREVAISPIGHVDLRWTRRE